MSGGVDSSVAAYLLKEQGYEVIGLFMRNWREEDDTGICTAEQDYSDVRRVSQTLDIPYYTVDFSKNYWDRVFTLFLDEYKKGRTPNPDVLCNREIKFNAFSDYARKMGADYIATGHYCDIEHLNDTHILKTAVDKDKDQTYFLNQVRGEQLKDTLFPLANLYKKEIRDIAAKLNLINADKKDSTGICFIGERNFRNFLKNYIPMQEGDIINLEGKVVGRHNGVYYYTVGQRRGLGIGGGGNGESYYIVKKDVINNILYVNQGLCEELFSREVITEGFNFISLEPKDTEFLCKARIRHRQSLVDAVALKMEGGLKITFEEKIKGVAEGQYAVLYDTQGIVCYGGGVIEKADRKSVV